MTVENFKELIDYTCTAIRLPHKDIQFRFANFSVCLMEYFNKDVHDKVVEVYFDNYKATLSATFDKNDICDYAILYPDLIDDIDQLLLFLSEKYDYDFLKSSWILSNCYMSIKEDKEGIIFIFKY